MGPISNGEVIATDARMDDFVEVMLGQRFPTNFNLGNSPFNHHDFYWGYPLLSIGAPIDPFDFPVFVSIMLGNDWWGSLTRCIDCGDETDGDDLCADCEWQRDGRDSFEPDVDEAQEWHDFDPDC